MTRRILALFALTLACLIVAGAGCKAADKDTNDNLIFSNMKITSTDFGDNDFIPVNFTCQGEGAMPSLRISGVPDNAVSLVVIIDDPDAPGGDFVHFLGWNIPTNTTEISNNSFPPGAVVGLGSTGSQSYVPPCPPSGTHRYQFKLYALDSMLNIPTRSSKKALLGAMDGKILAKGQMIGLYKKK